MSNPYAPKKRTAPVEAKTSQTEKPEETTTLEVPTGSVDKIMKWVGDDADKARAAYDVESEDKKRVSLLSQLKELF